MTWLTYEPENSKIQHYHYNHTFDCIILMNISLFTDCDKVHSPQVTERYRYYCVSVWNSSKCHKNRQVKYRL